jgi:hypothetical protein
MEYSNGQTQSPSCSSRRCLPWLYVALAVGGSVVLLVLLAVAFLPDWPILPHPLRMRISSLTNKQDAPTVPNTLPPASVQPATGSRYEAAVPGQSPLLAEIPLPFVVPRLSEDLSMELQWQSIDTEKACELPVPVITSPAAIKSRVGATPLETGATSPEASAARPQAKGLGLMPLLISQPREHLSEDPKTLSKPAPQDAKPAQASQGAQQVQKPQTPRPARESQEPPSARERPARPPAPAVALDSKRESAEPRPRALRKSPSQPTSRDSRGWYIRK